MIDRLQRRAFLKVAGAAAGSVCLNLGNASGREEAAPLSSPRLLTGCCAYSYGKYLETGKMTMEDFILKAVDLGVVGVDMTAYWLKSKEPAYLLNLRRLAYKHGIPFSGAACGTEMCEPNAGKRESLVMEIKQWVDVADTLGASHLRVLGASFPTAPRWPKGRTGLWKS